MKTNFTRFVRKQKLLQLLVLLRVTHLDACSVHNTKSKGFHFERKICFSQTDTNRHKQLTVRVKVKLRSSGESITSHSSTTGPDCMFSSTALTLSSVVLARS